MAKLLLALSPTMWLWGLNTQRFVPPLTGWTLWAVALGCLLLTWRAPLPTPIRAWRIEGRNAYLLLVIVSAVIVTGCVWRLPDTTYFIGDFIMRASAVRRSALDVSFPQSMPGDVLVHQYVPAALQNLFGLPLDLGSRLIGALEAAALGALGVAAAAMFRARGPLVVFVPVIVAAQGTLLLCTGFGKGITEVSLMSLAFILLGVRHASRPLRAPTLEVVLVTALWMHRSALALIAPYAVLSLGDMRRDRSLLGWMRAGGVLRLGVLVLGCAPIAARYVHTLGTFDLVHHLHLGQRLGARAILGEAFAPLHLLDILNLCASIAPSVPFVPFLVSSAGTLNRRVLWVFVSAIIPWVAALLFIHPQQGVFRDLDVFAPFAGVASLFAAWLSCQDGNSRGEPARRGPTLVAVTAAFTVISLLVINNDSERGLERALAFAVEAPERASAERAQVWSYLGDRDSERGAFGVAFEAYMRAAHLVPTPRRRLQAAIAAARGREYVQARNVCAALVQDDPQDLFAWIGYAGACVALRDTAQAARAVTQVRNLVGHSRRKRALVLNFLRAFPETWPGIRSPLQD